MIEQSKCLLAQALAGHPAPLLVNSPPRWSRGPDDRTIQVPVGAGVSGASNSPPRELPSSLEEGWPEAGVVGATAISTHTNQKIPPL
jgi:hypothetical protein